MGKPNLQIALDHNRLEDALADVINVGEIVDIIEIGTILCLQEGQKAISCIRSLFPEKIIVADTKCADAGGTVAKNVANAGADWMTAICCATIPTMKAADKEVKELQVELYGVWTLKLFEGLNVYTFIAGRGITACKESGKAAQDFQDEIERIWGK